MPNLAHNIEFDLGIDSMISETSDDYYTPKWIFDRMDLQFDLDVCAPLGGIPHIPAKNYYTLADNGLESPWMGRVWMNPPYSKPKPWVKKFIEHGNGIALVPLTKSQWFNDAWQKIDGIVVLPTNLKFHRNQEMTEIFAQTCLMAMGQDNFKALHKFGRLR